MAQDQLARLLSITEELARVAVKQASDLKPGEIGEVLARFQALKAEIFQPTDTTERNSTDAPT